MQMNITNLHRKEKNGLMSLLKTRVLIDVSVNSFVLKGQVESQLYKNRAHGSYLSSSASLHLFHWTLSKLAVTLCSSFFLFETVWKGIFLTRAFLYSLLWVILVCSHISLLSVGSIPTVREKTGCINVMCEGNISLPKWELEANATNFVWQGYTNGWTGRYASEGMLSGLPLY